MNGELAAVGVRESGKKIHLNWGRVGQEGPCPRGKKKKPKTVKSGG